MPDNIADDYYETLQVTARAEAETIHHMYRLLAKRFHPDNQDTGNAVRFYSIHEAYSVLSDSEERAQYDMAHQKHQPDGSRVASTAAESENDFEIERVVRLTVLEALYAQRRREPGHPGIFIADMEALVGRAREDLEFTIWYLVQKKLVQRGDNSHLLITADGADYLEQNHLASLHMRRLNAPSVGA
jgi:curved DNA-binding protein CbpA